MPCHQKRRLLGETILSIHLLVWSLWQWGRAIHRDDHFYLIKKPTEHQQAHLLAKDLLPVVCLIKMVDDKSLFHCTIGKRETI